ncbi:MAG TPA: zinc ABC transporter permease AztB [Acidimicrobiia bacterium]|nr:zinc ABC transporter permease AztB [Acidimicrobiia bacterium]
MDWLIEPFSLGFQQRALIAGLLAMGMAAMVGCWVVLRGLTFMGDALAHGVLPGVAVGLLLGFDPVLGALLSALVMAAGIGLVHRRASLTEDTAIGLMFVGMLGLGVVLISRTSSFSGSLTAILFGEILSASRNDLVLLGAGATVALALSIVLYRPFLVLCFNERKSELLGMNPQLAHFAMLALVTMAVVTSFRTVGSLLVFGLMVAPPATASLLVRKVPRMITAALAIGAVAVIGGLLISYHFGTAGSATISTLSVAFFFIALAFRGRPDY